MYGKYEVRVDCPACGEPLTCTVSPGDPGCRYTKNGDGWPPEPPQLEEIVGGCNCQNDPDTTEEDYLERVERAAVEALEDGDDDYPEPDED